jgi:hypothetical protein
MDDGRWQWQINKLGPPADALARDGAICQPRRSPNPMAAAATSALVRVTRVAGWSAVSLAGAGSVAVLALSKGEPVSDL